MAAIYHEIIKKLVAKCNEANVMTLVHPFSLCQAYTMDHFLLRNEGTTVYYAHVGQDPVLLLPGELLFVPSQKQINISFGSKDAPPVTTNFFIANYKNYLLPFAKTQIDSSYPGLSYINLDMNVLGGVNLFSLLDVPAFVIAPGSNIVSLYNYILTQKDIHQIERTILLEHAACLLAIELVRFL